MKNLGKSVLEQSGEEYAKGVAGRLAEKSYSPDKQWYSTKDENAVFNPKRDARQFAADAATAALVESSGYAARRLSDGWNGSRRKQREEDLPLTEEEFDNAFERGYNESDDYEEWERFTETLGNDAPESFQKFQEIKYAVPEEYADLEGLYQYKIENPSSGREFYEAEKAREMLRDAGVIRAKGVVVAVPDQEVIIFNTNEHARERLFERGLTVEEVQSFIDHAEFALKQQEGMVYAFYSPKGFAAVDINGELRTAGYLDENGMKLYYQVVKIIESYKR